MCGEFGSDSACTEPALHLPYSFHPMRLTRQTVRDSVRFPPAPAAWGELPDISTIAVADSLEAAGQVLKPNALRHRASLAIANRGEAAASAIAFLPGEDGALTSFWLQRGDHARRLANTFGLLIAPALSNWWSGTPLDGLIMLSATLGYAAYLARLAPTIPTLLWRTGQDIHRMVAWLAPTRPSAICLHLGTVSHGRAWRWCSVGLRILKGAFLQCNLNPRLLVYGISNINGMRSIMEIWRGDVTFASSRPFRLADGGNRLAEDLTWARDRTASKKALRIANCRAYRKAAELTAVGLVDR